MTFYYSSRAAVETVRVLDENDSVRRELLTAIDRAHLAIDWRKPGSDAFYESLQKSTCCLERGGFQNFLYQSRDCPHRGPFSYRCSLAVAAETHQRKAARTFSTMCTLMEQYPEFTFIQSQPQALRLHQDRLSGYL